MTYFEFHRYKNIYRDRDIYIIGKGRTTFNFRELRNTTDPVIFINDAVQFECMAPNSVETFFFCHDKSQKVWINQRLCSTLVLTDTKDARDSGGDNSMLTTHDLGDGYCKINNRLIDQNRDKKSEPEMVEYRSLAETDFIGDWTSYAWGGWLNKSDINQVNRDRLAETRQLILSSGTIHTAIHFAWYLGCKRILFVGCDGLNSSFNADETYNPAIRILSGASPGNAFQKIRKVQDKLCKILNIETEYIGTPVENKTWKKANLRWRGSALAEMILTKHRLCDEIYGVEVGVLAGRLSQYLLSVFPNLWLAMVDPWKIFNKTDDYYLSGDLAARRDLHHVERDYKTTRAVTSFAGDRARIIRAFSADAVSEFSLDGVLDFVFIDGNHTFDGTFANLREWYRKVKPGGIMAGHDIDNDSVPEAANWDVRGALEGFIEYEGIDVEIMTGDDYTWFFTKPMTVNPVTQIPKIAHFIWLGGDQPQWVEENIRLFSKYHTDWYINFVNDVPDDIPKIYRELIDNCELRCQQKDILEYWLLHQNGGVFLDCDIMTLRNIDDLLSLRDWACKQQDGRINNSVIGARKNSPRIEELLRTAVEHSTDNARNWKRAVYGPNLLTSVDNLLVLPKHYFYLFNWHMEQDQNEAHMFWHANDLKRKKMLDEKRQEITDDKEPYLVHLWGVDKSGQKKVEQEIMA